MDGMYIPLVGGLLVTIVTVGGTIFLFARIFGGLSKNRAERERLIREGIQTGAQLMAVQMGGMSMTVGVHRHLELQLQLQVLPPGGPPYQAMLTTMVSELQIPQLQPGAMLTIRVDRNDPMKVALEGVGAPAPQTPMGYRDACGAAANPYGAPPNPYAAAPNPYAAAPNPYGGMPMTAPVYGAPPMPIGAPPVMPAGAKIGLWIGLGGGLIGIIIAIVVVSVNVFGVGLGSGSATGSGSGGGGGATGTGGASGGSACAQAIRCCEVVSAGSPSASNCKNLGKIGVPSSVCEQTLKSFSDSAKAQGKSCH